MAVITPSTTVSSGVIVNLGTADSVNVKKHILLSSSNEYTISGTGSNQSAMISGFVHSGYIGLLLGSSLSTGNKITVAESGTVDADYAAILSRGTNTSIAVHGMVAAGSYGVAFRGSDTDTVSTLVNTGTISANLAVFRDSSGTTETIKVFNSGLIEGASASYGVYVAGHNAKDLITNTGKMVGAVNLDGGDDRYAGSKGRVDGDVMGGEGNDTLIGGKEKNVFFGDAGLDKLTGGLGADELTGGTGRDQFIYKSVKDSTVNPTGRDTIHAFDQLESDQINLRAIDANIKQNGNQKFNFIDDGNFHGKAGELRFSHVGGSTLVQGDVNGDKKADFSIVLDSIVDLTASDFML